MQQGRIQSEKATLNTGGCDTSKSTGRSGRQNAATRRNMRRAERVTVQGPVKKQQPDGMSHGGGGGGWQRETQTKSTALPHNGLTEDRRCVQEV